MNCWKWAFCCCCANFPHLGSPTAKFSTGPSLAFNGPSFVESWQKHLSHVNGVCLTHSFNFCHVMTWIAMWHTLFVFKIFMFFCFFFFHCKFMMFFLNWMNFLPCNGFVKKSDHILSVLKCLTLTLPQAITSLMKWCRTSMCLVRLLLLNPPLFSNGIALLLSW